MGLTKGQFTDKICALSRVLLHIFCYYWGKGNRLFYRGPGYIEVCYIEVPLYAV